MPSRFDKSSRAILAYRALLKHVLGVYLQAKQARQAEIDARTPVVSAQVIPLKKIGG